ncbi:MAG: adenylosuccinate synthetase [Elusimicrobia bacterium CG08_land_8_20_14_0_20_51_18]|nr:MAG: adenylosuccinate synthetase [Elusimicrobia bacterium CG08_land_8_20_14_0_20_51_18]
MPVDIIVGGQAGDEGKGKICAYLAYKGDYQYAVKVGGPNAGHTVFYKDRIYALKSIPAGFVNKKTKLALGAGTYIITDWLLKEMADTDSANRIIIDPNAVVIEPRQMEKERGDARMMKTIGSVGTGLGEAVKERIERKPLRFAKDEPRLKPYIKEVSELLNKSLQKGGGVLLEGTQGFKLSLLHGEYPYVTSRDTTASTFLAEAGLGPKYVRDVYAIFKPYVSRVGPGPLENEVTDPETLDMHHTKGREVGSVSGRLRRIGAFEERTARKTVAINSATRLAITHIDTFKGNAAARKPAQFTAAAKAFVKKIEGLSKIYPYPKLTLISYGPGLLDVLDIGKPR